MKVFEIRLWLDCARPGFKFSARGLLEALHHWLKERHDGACHGDATDTLMIAQVRAPTLELFMPLVDAYAEKLRRSVPDLNLLMNEAPQSVLTREQEHMAEALSAEPSKLTRRYFVALPGGVLLASNLWRDGREVFVESVAATAGERNAQWKRIVASGAAQRLCRVFPSERHFLEWSSEMRRYFGFPEAEQAKAPGER